MTAISKAAIKAFFETGDKPTQAQFIDFIDSYPNLADGEANLFTKKTILYSDITTPGTTFDYLLEALPAKRIMMDFFILQNTQFTGPSISSVFLYPWNSTNVSAIRSGTNICALLSNQQILQTIAVLNANGRYTDVWNFCAHFVSAGANLNALSAGSVSVFYRTLLLP